MIENDSLYGVLVLLFDPTLNGEELRFHRRGSYNGMLLIWDDLTNTYWNHITGEGLHGDNAGATLNRLMLTRQMTADEALARRKITNAAIAHDQHCRTTMGLWHIQLQPAPERWFDLELVLDASPSMVLWQQSIAELYQLLNRHGAFRHVRAWRLNTDATEEPLPLMAGLHADPLRQAVRSPCELISPARRRLILVVTDAVSAGWHHGSVTRLLATWGKHHPLALVQVLPERLWSGSALQPAPLIKMRSPQPDVANTRLSWSFVSSLDRILWKTDPPITRNLLLPMPILTLDGTQVAAWARLVTGMGRTTIRGFALNPQIDDTAAAAAEHERPTDSSHGDPVRQFRASASPEAFRLAQWLAAVPLSLPVMRLVQQTMMPHTRQGHLAEVFLSGLLWQRTPAATQPSPELVWYDFRPGIRAELCAGLSLDEQALVLQVISTYIQERYGSPRDFTALLFDPAAVGGLMLNPELAPFAEVLRSFHERLGLRSSDDQGSAGVADDTPLLVSDEPAPEVPPVIDPELAQWPPNMIEIPAGSFLMGSSDNDFLADDDEKPQHTLELPTYYISQTPITNAQFRPFVEGDGYTNPNYWTTNGWQWRQNGKIIEPRLWNDPQWNGADYPVVGINWFEAVAYCRWLSTQTGQKYRLPTEAEWEKAARGPDGHIWPWGNQWEAGRCNSEEAGLKRTTPVGSYPSGASPYGVLDMAGNVWEWCATHWRKNYPYQLEDEWNERYLEQRGQTDWTVIRGGAHYSSQKSVRGANRYDLIARYHSDNNVGIRLASYSPL
ncbi:MAG: SUMF1/EgtB/PvdO family nonheme iron enzyme [Chloroflexaceae bacterium]|nr:SUMF1/EgtB/PvdO family nonheme iron enzyme [Chloroflexaceae bacterium]